MKQVNEKFWNNYFKSYDVLKHVLPYNNMIKEVTKLMVGRKVLDIGSGTGNFISYMNKKGTEAFGIDISDVGISISKKRGLKNKVFKKNIILDDLPFKKNSFNGILMVNTFYFIDPNKRDLVMKKILKVIENNSRLIIIDMKNTYKPFIIYKTHIKESFYEKGLLKTLLELFKLLLPTIKVFFYNIIIMREYRPKKNYFFSKEEYLNFLKKYNFDIIKVEDIFAKQSILIVADRNI